MATSFSGTWVRANLGGPVAGFQYVDHSIAFDFTGDRLAAAGPEGALMVWNVGLDSLRRRACEVAGRQPGTRRRVEALLPRRTYQVTCGQALLAKANRAATLGQDDAARTAYTEAVAFASTRAGSSAGERYLLVWHSQWICEAGAARLRPSG